MAEQFSSEKLLNFLFDDDFYLSLGCNSNEECSEVPSDLGNNELHTQDLNTLDTAVSSAGKASSDSGSSDECEDDESLCLQKTLAFCSYFTEATGCHSMQHNCYMKWYL